MQETWCQYILTINAYRYDFLENDNFVHQLTP